MSKLKFLKKWYISTPLLIITLFSILFCIQFLSRAYFGGLIFYIPATYNEVNQQTAINCSPDQFSETQTPTQTNNSNSLSIPYPPSYDYKASIQCFMNAYRTCKSAYITPFTAPDSGSTTYISVNFLGKCMVKIIYTPGFVLNGRMTKDYCANVGENAGKIHMSFCTNLENVDYPSQ